ncbi:hypothetical protein PTSG_09662 [Salpingoeca rosetta]|uniref:Uncharacterized protein n=1 Tax=Salpingoeca rosetta (strain ATCC 50818 / BSB-021) TaxID=946362 RepID=F2ULM5_SALR5|nr:uncharacterized protein PTSG_09662 [Salpingoeca rosetta]EGD78024.1 hypothetical protein PTSG_09662 [Salpingoeca rosetta]|eukprot:XP_004990086.1 hypothetical protein PTSG_09662 [Salpingoeca rosetta]
MQLLAGGGRRRRPWTLAGPALVLALVVLVVMSDRPYMASQKRPGTGPKHNLVQQQQQRQQAPREQGRPWGKVLVGMTVGKKCRARVEQMLEDWGRTQFNYMFFVYDGTDWSALEALDGVTVLQTRALKMHHYKANVPPERVDGYDFFLLLDCDVGLAHFDVHSFLDIQWERQIPIAQPSVAWGELRDRSSDHRVCRNVPGPHYGRWTTFIECGPFVSFMADAWRCVYDLVQGDLGSGWGLDYKWCAYARDVCRLRPALKGPIRTSPDDGGRVCAVIDAQVVDHLDERTAFGRLGSNYQPRQDAVEFERRFPDVESTTLTNCLCACDCRGGPLRSVWNTFVRSTQVFGVWNFLQCECRF